MRGLFGVLLVTPEASGPGEVEHQAMEVVPEQRGLTPVMTPAWHRLLVRDGAPLMGRVAVCMIRQGDPQMASCLICLLLLPLLPPAAASQTLGLLTGFSV